MQQGGRNLSYSRLMPTWLLWFSFLLCKMDRRVFHRLLWGALRARELFWRWLECRWHYCNFEITPLLYHCRQEQQQRRTQMLEDALCWDYFPCCSFKLAVSVTCLLPVLVAGPEQSYGEILRQRLKFSWCLLFVCHFGGLGSVWQQ